MRYAFVPSGSASTASMISSGDCVPTGMSHSGQCIWPSRESRMRK